MVSLTIATAGHVDHGKSSLILALTGSDPDRLAEEKRRGMTIELGFAHVTVDNAIAQPGADRTVLSFIDVPGHSDLVRTMITGASAAEAALCVVDVREGMKPQTWEHLAVLELLGITDGVIALSKCDLVDEAAIDQRRQEIANALATRPITWHAIVPTSVHTHRGIDDLAHHLARLARSHRRNEIDWNRPRLGVDRVFTIAGSGTVVTGTLEHGSVRKGDELVIARTGRTVRVRGLHLHGHDVENIDSVSRCAINLADCDVAELQRGDAVIAPHSWHLSDTFDVEMRVVRGSGGVPRQGGGYIMHLGTHRQPVTLRYLGPTPPDSGATTVAVRLRGAHGVPVTPGDRFILRSSGEDATIGGGVIFDVAPRRRPSHVTIGTTLTDISDEELCEYQLDVHGWIPLDHAQRLTGRLLSAHVGHYTSSRRTRDRTLAELTEKIDRGDVPLAELTEWERHLIVTIPDVTVVQGLARRGSIDLESHPIARQIREAGVVGPSTSSMDRATIRLLASARVIWEHDSIAFHRDTLTDVVPILHQLMTSHPDGFTMAQLRDALGITRKHAVPLATCLDKAGITIRRGDLRVMRPQ